MKHKLNTSCTQNKQVRHGRQAAPMQKMLQITKELTLSPKDPSGNLKGRYMNSGNHYPCIRTSKPLGAMANSNQIHKMANKTKLIQYKIRETQVSVHHMSL
jgi:hypothetical protein